MNYISNNIARNLKRIRTARKMSLDRMAEQTGVSKSMLGQIERSESNPTIETLAKIVSGLRITFEDLVEEPDDSVYQVDFRDMTPTKHLEGKYDVYTYFSFIKNRKFEIYRIDIEPGGRYESGSHGEKTEEYLTVISGTLTMLIDGKDYEVRTRDAMRFNTNKKHVYINRSKEKVSVIIYFVFRPKM